jgi:transposase
VGHRECHPRARSNARAEGLNSQIRAMRVKARGYRNRERFKNAILFMHGQLDMRI